MASSAVSPGFPQGYFGSSDMPSYSADPHPQPLAVTSKPRTTSCPHCRGMSWGKEQSHLPEEEHHAEHLAYGSSLDS